MEFVGEYKFIKTIGAGSFGKVKLALHLKTNTNVAIKVIDKTEVRIDEQKIKKEIELFQNFRHPHVMKVYESFSVSENLYVVMEYVSGGDLFEILCHRGKFKEAEARQLFQQLIAGVEYSHSKGVAHRDLKPENLLLDQQRYIKIADFGLSANMKEGSFMHTSCGSPNYAAPEIISGRPYCGTEADAWSCGVILYALLSATLPFDDENITILFKKIKTAQFYYPKYFSENAKDLLGKILQSNPAKRLTIKEIKQHPWFVQDLPLYLTIYDEFDINNTEKKQEIDILLLEAIMGHNCIDESEKGYKRGGGLQKTRV